MGLGSLKSWKNIKLKKNRPCAKTEIIKKIIPIFLPCSPE